jgi:hypothetical protein
VAAATDVGVLLPLRIETRFRDGDLHLRVVPDEPWFVRDDPRISDGELTALRRYVDAANAADGDDAVQVAWRELAAHVGPARAVFLLRRFVTTDASGTATVRVPSPDDLRDEPTPPRIVGFPPALAVWISSGGEPPRRVLDLAVDRSRLLADFPDEGEKRWWEDWDEAVEIGMAGVVPAAELAQPIDGLFVTGVGDAKPAELFSGLIAEGRLGLIRPGTPTNTVEGAPAAPLANDPATWWSILDSPPRDGDRELSAALTGDPDALGPVPGGDAPHRAQSSALVTLLWPALWGFAAAGVWDVARGSEPALWARGALHPEGPYPTVRVGAQPYGLLPTTAWRGWTAADGDPRLEPRLVQALLEVLPDHVARARARGTVAGASLDELLDLIGQTPTSSRFRFRLAWPLEVWWLVAAAAGLPARWRAFSRAWDQTYPLAGRIRLPRGRRYGARGRPRLVGIPLVVPEGVDDFPELLRKLGAAAVESPSSFAQTAAVEQNVLGGLGASLLLRLAVRSLQLLIADVARERDGVDSFDPEPLIRPDRQRGRVEELVRSVGAIDTVNPTPAVARLLDASAALTALADVPVADLQRMLCASIDSANHRIDPWLSGVALRRLESLRDAGMGRWRLGAYGWVDDLAPGTPGPTSGGLLPAPSFPQALTSAVLRDRAVSEPDQRWDLDVTSRRARIAERVAAHVRVGADLTEALGREVERIVASTPEIEQLRSQFPVRTEHAGRRVCDGLQVLAQEPFPVPLDADQAAAVAELREALDTYGDLIVADAVFHLTEGRAETAGAVLQSASGFGRPPEPAVLRTVRDGRAVSSSVVLALTHVPAPPLPADAAGRALAAPAALVDASAAAFVSAQVGAAAAWEFEVAATVDAATETVTLADLGLEPADALALTLGDLERLAAEEAAARLGLDPREVGPIVVDGSARDRYEDAARLVGLIGRKPAGRAAVAEDAGADDQSEVVASVVGRFLAARSALTALASQLRSQVALTAPDLGLLERLLVACRAWGVAPDPPPAPAESAATVEDARTLRLVARAARALALLEQRLAAAPDEGDAEALGRDDALAALVRLVSPTGQLAITGELAGAALPALEAADEEDGGLDDAWLTVAAAVRPSLAELERHQLTAATPFRSWTNRRDDPWQRDASRGARLVAVYADPDLDLAAVGPSDVAAAAIVDGFTEVIPDRLQHGGAAFGFDAPASRAQQAILLAVPPVVGTALDDEAVVEIVSETRELAQARMARPVDLAGQFWGMAPTALLPASGRTAIPLESA